MNTPLSTYRIQFNQDFTFSNMEQILPYLHRLGITTIYASPIFTAVPGSRHGYDVLNPLEINPEIGTKEQLIRLSKAVKACGMSWLQDIVPNHMAFHPQNFWLMDVLEKGLQSPYAPYFDTVFADDFYREKLMVPFLGKPLEEVIRQKELQVSFKQERFVLSYADYFWPVNPRSYAVLLQSGEGEPAQAIQQLLALHPQIRQFEDTAIYYERWEEFRLQLTSLLKDEAINSSIQEGLNKINANPDLLQQIAEAQEYRLCFWKETDEKINYRRFFTINSLICLNMQHEAVFEHYHRLVKELIDADVFQGLRIDHVDGLYNPDAYLKNLRKLAGDKVYITVEKILSEGERLPAYWPVQGSTGYDFMTFVSHLFTDSRAEANFTGFYQDLTGQNTLPADEIRIKKAEILQGYMQGELDNLYHLFVESAGPGTEKFHPQDIKSAIGGFLIECPVYRFYGQSTPLEKLENDALKGIFKQIRRRKPELYPVIDLLEAVLTGSTDSKQNNAFYLRCMQFAGPLMAKGVEDTLFYTYNRFIGHNEVGGTIETFGITPEVFHHEMLFRQKSWPLSSNATATHDTKRGEDVRARLNVLSDMPDEWFAAVRKWRELNTPFKSNNFPGANEEYFIYQTLAGTYPMPGQADDTFPDRMQQYLLKAFREAKQHTQWAEPDEAYEEAVSSFLAAICRKDSSFQHEFQTFMQQIYDFGIMNSLSQLLLKLTCPGMPDNYQGTELWDLSLVDPDNRRNVNYQERELVLETFEGNSDRQFVADLWSERYDGKIKLWFLYRLLHYRNRSGQLFTAGEYIPLEIRGKYREHIFAFARQVDQSWCVIIVPLHLFKLAKRQQQEITTLDWDDTHILLPEKAPQHWRNLLQPAAGKHNGRILVKEAFPVLPLAALTLESSLTQRGAGVLLHISSLPSAFGIGDLGPEAKKMIGFLSRSGQKYWQLLPLNPAGKQQHYSPYSAYSAMAGNPLLISPELLADENLIDSNWLKKRELPSLPKVNFEMVEEVKNEVFNEAWRKFSEGNFKELHYSFIAFCNRQDDWLDDFALYTALKQHHNNRPWYNWPEKYKHREIKALNEFATRHSESLNKIRWLQFLFFRQWGALKAFGNQQGILFFGDVPFYVGYDSADVWANREIFCLDASGEMTVSAGVPPDYFNDDGQLWGMPVFNWEKLKKQQYSWWLKRLHWNMELFDLLRFDHFRAFSTYWEVPAGENTAKNGTWIPGPGAGFFKRIQKKLGTLPFVAEDLGDIDEAVHQLRDAFHFPGMKVLQFAFSEDMGTNPHIPHQYTRNFIVYTGTHDNNTVKGWFRQDADRVSRNRLEMYAGLPVSEKNVHQVICRMAYASTARIAIVPVQDILGLDETCRMNTPASTENNWLWRLQPGMLTKEMEAQLKEWTILYGR